MVIRKNPVCLFCGKAIAKAVYLDQSNVDPARCQYGDTFLRWDYDDHKCSNYKYKRRSFDRTPKQ